MLSFERQLRGDAGAGATHLRASLSKGRFEVAHLFRLPDAMNMYLLEDRLLVCTFVYDMRNYTLDSSSQDRGWQRRGEGGRGRPSPGEVSLSKARFERSPQRCRASVRQLVVARQCQRPQAGALRQLAAVMTRPTTHRRHERFDASSDSELTVAAFCPLLKYFQEYFRAWRTRAWVRDASGCLLACLRACMLACLLACSFLGPPSTGTETGTKQKCQTFFQPKKKHEQVK